jgi:hypothetical protein
MRSKKPELPPLEELGREVHEKIDGGMRLLQALQEVSAKYERHPNQIRNYWKNYADYHKLEYSSKTHKITSY